ncbi:MAG TPA: hypothetical protein VGR26_07645 [Acidimicrobiales bacterium]|nr:hypothetical protein [Acidimicrobiales bacterium]
MKGLRVLVVLGVVLVVSLIAGAYAAGQETRPLSAPEAREFTERAFTFSGVDSVEVTGEPRSEVFTATDQEGQGENRGEEGQTREPIEVWVVPATVSGQPVELYVARQGGRAVNLDDALPGGGFVLDDEQFARLAEFRLDLAREDLQEKRQGPALVAGLLIALAAVLLLVSVLRGQRGGEDAPPAPAGVQPTGE